MLWRERTDHPIDVRARVLKLEDFTCAGNGGRFAGVNDRLEDDLPLNAIAGGEVDMPASTSEGFDQAKNLMMG